MAMARLLRQTLLHRTRPSAVPLSPLILSHRHRSGKAQRAQIIEVDLDSSSSSSPSSASPSSPEGSQSSSSDEEKINGGIRKLEEVVQNIIVRRSAPDWLPFRPGSSYWVPPLPTSIRNNPYGGVVEVLGRLSNASRVHAGDGQGPSRSLAMGGPFPNSELLSHDELMPLSSSRGWPSPSYFIEGETIW